MLLMGSHLLALEAHDANGSVPIADQHTTMTPATWSTYHMLELQGLAESQPDGRYVLTPQGQEAARLVILGHQQALLPPASTMGQNWRFLGSEILAALAAAAQAGGAVGSVTQELLRTRGLAEDAKGDGGAGLSLKLNSVGMRWLALARTCRPHLRITPELATTIRHLPPSYSPLHAFTLQSEHLWELEAMDLLVWTVPEADVYALTALGEAVYEAIEKGAYPQEGTALDENSMHLLAALADHGPTALAQHEYELLQRLGYLDADCAPTAAGEAALRALRILECEPATRPVSFASASDEIALLQQLQSLAASTAETTPAMTRTALHEVLLDRAEKQYQDYVGAYGRTIEDVTARKQEAHEMQAHLRVQERTFGHPGKIDELLMRLEAWDLVCAMAQGTTIGYRVTARGNQLLDELHHCAADEQPEEISSTAVKAITSAATATRFGAPATDWVQQAHAEGLLGSRGITRFGRYIAGLARTCPRLPILTRTEADVLVHLPAYEPAHDPVSATRRGSEGAAQAFVRHALDRLEARGLIDRLVDGHVVRTEAGATLTRAVQGALELAYPVTPALLRVLLAIHQVHQSLYAKDKKGYLTSQTWEEVERLSGLGADTFREVVHLARLGQYLGDANLTEAGEDLLAVMAHHGKAWPAA